MVARVLVVEDDSTVSGVLCVYLRKAGFDPGIASRSKASGDELARALSNLVGNAVRHTREQGQVCVSARRASDGRAWLAVTDGCGGIKDDDLSRVFDIGWCAEPERGTNDAGAGLGPAIARGVIEAHAGSISVANIDGGCRFDVELPGQA